MWAGQETYSHITNLVIHLRVVYDFTQNIERFVGENLQSSVGQINTTLYAVAKTELLRELDGQSPGFAGNFTGGTQTIDQITAVMRKHLRFDLLHDIRSPKIDALRFAGSVR